MGDEKKIKKLKKEIDDIFIVIDRLEMDSVTKMTLDEKQNKISEIYNDFIDNYLDFREISDKLYDGIYISDGTGKTIFVNNAYSRTTGIKGEDIIGRKVKDISDENKFFKGPVTMDVIEKKAVVNSLGKSLVNDKELLITGSPIFDNNGNVKLVVINNRDISDLKDLEFKNAELQLDKQRANEEIEFLRRQQKSNSGMIFESDKMKSVMELVSTIAPTDVTVLITGESGTGKEVIADEIHLKSNRSEKPFIKVNCAAIPNELLESELFGYEGGAFTDANKSGKIGMFELANQGTILLDEIGDMSLNLQSKLLRVLHNKEIVRIGGNKAIKLDMRVIAATNKDLQEEIEKGKFREDLYYRLNVVPIEVKPLRERKEEIYSLSHEFLNKFNKKYNKGVYIEKDAIHLLKVYNWPGNIRELENLIERLVVVSNDGVIKYNNLTSALEMDDSNYINKFSDLNKLTLKEAVQRLEKDIIKNAINEYGSVNKAAAKLGISQPALWKKCKNLNIESNNKK